MNKSQIEEFAKSLGIFVASRKVPGTRATLYKFDTVDRGFFESEGVFVAKGAREAHCFLRGVQVGAWIRRKKGPDED